MPPTDYLQALLSEQRRKQRELSQAQTTPAPAVKKNLPDYMLTPSQLKTADEPASQQLFTQDFSTPPPQQHMPVDVPATEAVNRPVKDDKLGNFLTLFFLQDNVDDALVNIFTTVNSVFKFDFLELMFLDEEQEVVFLFAIDSEGSVPGEDFITYKDTPLAAFLGARKAVCIPDLAAKEDYIFTDFISEYGLTSMLQLPCATAFGFMGFLNFYSADRDAFTFENQEYAQLFANLMAVFLENMNMREKLSLNVSSTPPPSRADLQLARYIEHELEHPLEELKQHAINLGKKNLGRLAPKQNEFLDLILAIADESKKRTEQLQEYLYAVSGKVVPEIKRLEVLKVFSDVQAALQPRMEAKTVRMLLEADKKFPPILADQKLLRRVLIAIMENAIDMTRIGGVFRLSAYDDGRKAEIAVCDFGVEPIAKDDYENIFTPFAFFEHTLSSKHGKMFLNLPLVKIYVELMGGTISVDSSKEHGTLFSIKLPFAGSN